MRVEQVLISIISRGSVQAMTVSVLEAFRDKNPALAPLMFATSPLSSCDARNQALEFFRRNNQFEALIMVDDDVFPPLPDRGNILELVDWLEVKGEFGIVGAAYPVFQPQLAPLPMIAAYKYHPNKKAFSPINDGWIREGVQEVDAVGFGCVAIHRNVVEKLESPWFKDSYVEGNISDFQTDDFYFCQAATKAGFSIACHFDLKCEHFKSVELIALMEGVFSVMHDQKTGDNSSRDLIRARNGNLLPQKAVKKTKKKKFVQR